MHVANKRKNIEEQGGGKSTQDPVPVAEWLPWYGTDSYYPSRRVRRITERAYYKARYCTVENTCCRRKIEGVIRAFCHVVDGGDLRCGGYALYGN